MLCFLLLVVASTPLGLPSDDYVPIYSASSSYPTHLSPVFVSKHSSPPVYNPQPKPVYSPTPEVYKPNLLDHDVARPSYSPKRAHKHSFEPSSGFAHNKISSFKHKPLIVKPTYKAPHHDHVDEPVYKPIHEHHVHREPEYQPSHSHHKPRSHYVEPAHHHLHHRGSHHRHQYKDVSLSVFLLYTIINKVKIKGKSNILYIIDFLQEVKPYAFDYGVRDDYHGTNFGHSEKSDGKEVRGSYTVALPDGRIQKVTYVADHYNGYQAKVSYEGKAKFPAYNPKSNSYHGHSSPHKSHKSFSPISNHLHHEEPHHHIIHHSPNAILPSYKSISPSYNTHF